MCVAVLVIEMLVLIIVDPSAGRCPGWIINATKQSALSLWVLIGICTALPTIWICLRFRGAKVGLVGSQG